MVSGWSPRQTKSGNVLIEPSVIIAIAPFRSSELNHFHSPAVRKVTPTVNKKAAMRLVRHGHLFLSSLNGFSKFGSGRRTRVVFDAVLLRVVAAVEGFFLI